jgi:hypothetical protein
MELEHINPLLEKYKKTITRDIIKKLYEKYTIYDEDDIVSEKEIKDYLEKLNNPVKKRCCGVSKSSGVPKQCKSFAITNFDYCKSHMMTYGTCSSLRRNKIEENIDIDIDVEICKNIVGDHVDLSNLKMKFIEDSFYYVDTYFIYNKLKQKVGYLENDEYILTDDPYILNNF